MKKMKNESSRDRAKKKAVVPHQPNAAKGILRYYASDIWEGDMESMRRDRAERQGMASAMPKRNIKTHNLKSRRVRV